MTSTTVEHNFSSALSIWKEINLSELQKELDKQGLEIIENQKESVIGRKLLAERTKEFKKTSDEEKLNAWKGLLKAYQTEIDSLTKRSKVSENSFLSLYKKLAEAPDPYPLLDAAIEQTIKASQIFQIEHELKTVKDENNNLTRRIHDMSTAEAALKKAEARAQILEERIEDMVAEKVLQKQNELNATYDERIRNYEEREQTLTRQMSLAMTQLRDLRTSNENNQARLFDQSQKQDQDTVAKLAELDLIVADLERTNARAGTAERRNELLRAEIESLKSGSDITNEVLSLKNQIIDLSSEAERMSRTLDAQKGASLETETKLQRKIDDVSRELSTRMDEITGLRKKLKQYNDYDEIKRELEIMKYVEFGGLDEDEAADSEGNFSDNSHSYTFEASVDTKSRPSNSLESLLVIKNRRTAEELTKMRILHSDFERSVRELSEELDNVRSELDTQRVLNENLENDLLKLNHMQRIHSGEGISGKDIMSDFNIKMNNTNDSSTHSAPIPFTSSADMSILPIVTSQRDRFRQRNAELEDELRKQFRNISELRNEIKTLQSDNLKLYEKMRYMQSYEASSSLDPLPAARHDDLSKYSARYEEAMNPFEAFRGREASRALQALNPIEKAVLSLTKAILGSRRARTFFICYALALHLLVMITTYECTTTSGTTLRTEPIPYMN